ncbi:putative ATP-dependent RNA helicase TDRD12 [Folsomia candida]|uniref:RNA helicase n=1 Tax=Folsomia candida TaxID=158441 RepID=A0A226DLX0_FOLCA|nr:putative ATP-dependent RNA helicase TDRD12 [Folsomia candida]
MAVSSSRYVPTGLENFNYLDLIDTSDEDRDKGRKGPSEPWDSSKNVLVSRHVANFPEEDYAVLNNKYFRRAYISGLMKSSPLSSINHFEHVDLMRDGIKNFSIIELNSLQKGVLPHLCRGDDCFIIGGIRTGKTLSYLIPVIGRLVTGYNEAEIRQARRCSPLLIIVCSDHVACLKMKGTLHGLLCAINQRHLSYDVISDMKDLSKFKPDLSIVVSTCSLMCNLVQKSSTFIGFDKLRYLVYEDLDVLMEYFREEFDTLRETIFQIARSNVYFYQRIFTGRKWNQQVEQLYMSTQRLCGPAVGDRWAPTLFINSHNQLIKYGEVKWYFHHTNPGKERIEKLLELLRSVELVKHKTIFIVSSTADFASWIHSHLAENGIYALLADTDSMRVDLLNDLLREWTSGPATDRQIMVLNDSALSRLNIRNVTCLIHYNLPKNPISRISSEGAERFTCMWNNYRDIAMEKACPQTKYLRKDLEAHFLLTGEEKYLYRLHKFGRDLLQQIPGTLTTIACRMEQQAVAELPLCQRVKLFGNCLDNDCKDRHIFLLKDLEQKPRMHKSIPLFCPSFALL